MVLRRRARTPTGDERQRLLRRPRRRGDRPDRRGGAQPAARRRLLRRGLDAARHRPNRRHRRCRPAALPRDPRPETRSLPSGLSARHVPHAPDRGVAAAGSSRVAELSGQPFPPGDYPVVVVGSGPGGLQTSYSLSRLGIAHAVISADDAPGGMFRRFPLYQRLVSWTKPDAPCAPGTREYEWYDQNSLIGDQPEHQWTVVPFMGRSSVVLSRPEMEHGLAAFAWKA